MEFAAARPAAAGHLARRTALATHAHRDAVCSTAKAFSFLSTASSSSSARVLSTASSSSSSRVLSTASSSSTARALSTSACAAAAVLAGAGSYSVTKAAIRTCCGFPCLLGAMSTTEDPVLTASAGHPAAMWSTAEGFPFLFAAAPPSSTRGLSCNTAQAQVCSVSCLASSGHAAAVVLARFGSGSAMETAIRTSCGFSCLVGARLSSEDLVLTACPASAACSSSAAEATALAFASGIAVRPVPCSYGCVLWSAIEPSAPTTLPCPLCCIASAGTALAFPCIERARAASALEAMGFSIVSSAREDAQFNGAEASVATGFHLPAASSHGFTSVPLTKGLPFACSVAARPSDAEAGVLYATTGASARILPRGTVTASPNTSVFNSSRGCLGVMPPASATELASFLSTSGGADRATPRAMLSWRNKSAAIRCKATRSDDARTLYQERLFQVSLLCLLVQKSIRDPASVQAAYDQASAAAWKRVHKACILVSCLIVGWEAARNNSNAILFVKIVDGAMKCYKLADEISKLF